jgi:cell division protein FtsL
MLILFGSIVIAAIITIVTYTRRRKAILSLKEEEKLIRGGQ